MAVDADADNWIRIAGIFVVGLVAVVGILATNTSFFDRRK